MSVPSSPRAGVPAVADVTLVLAGAERVAAAASAFATALPTDPGASDPAEPYDYAVDGG